MKPCHAASRLFGILAVALLAGCNDDGLSPQVIEDTSFAASLGIDLAAFTRTSSGVYIEDVAVGEGDPAGQGDELEVSYAGWLSDGVQFDSGSFGFTLGVGDVIAGFDQGVSGMRVGGVRRMIIPPALGYGNSGSGPIPGGAVLIFRVEVLSIG